MKTLNEINKIYKSDKGVTHNYLNFYEKEFENIRNEKNNILEIGVLFGNSLKLWSDYFDNSNIYGIENFSQKDGHMFYNFKPVIIEEVIKNIEVFKRIKLLIFDCENQKEIHKNLSNLKFDIIIDDASHDLEQQKKNYLNYHHFLKENSIYVCEDVQSKTESEELVKYFYNITPNRKIEVFEFDINKKSDDRLIIVK